jgi:thymidylate kinase
MDQGKFIAIYGINNTGKSSQVVRLGHWLKDNGKRVEVVKYPVYQMEPTGPIIYSAFRHGLEISDYNLQKLCAQNRRDFEVVIRDGMLRNGTWVLAEAYTGTGIAWGVANGIPIRVMEEMNADLLEEDFAILLDGKPFSTGIERGHRFEDNSEAMTRGREVHRMLAERYGWEVVDSNRSEDEVAKDIRSVVKRRLL